jgi:hypothetical protein
MNNANIWMDKFDNVEQIISSNPIINYTRIEHYDIGCKFCIKPQCSLSTIPCTIPKRNELIPNANFYFQLCKLNKEQHAIYDNCMYRKIMYLNQPIYLFLIGGASTSKTFTILPLI